MHGKYITLDNRFGKISCCSQYLYKVSTEFFTSMDSLHGMSSNHLDITNDMAARKKSKRTHKGEVLNVTVSTIPVKFTDNFKQRLFSVLS